MKSLSKAKVRYYSPPKKSKISLLPCFWANKFDINNLIARFMYEDDVTTSFFCSGNIYVTLSIQIKKNQIPKILPMWVFVPLKC